MLDVVSRWGHRILWVAMGLMTFEVMFFAR